MAGVFAELNTVQETNCVVHPFASKQEVEFSREDVTTIWDELLPVFKRHHDEVSSHPDFELNPNKEIYFSLENSGALRVFTAREHGEIIGYMVYMVCPHLHYPKMKQAYQDSLFIDKAKRGFGMQFMKWCNQSLEDDGVQYIFQQVNMKHNFSPILERMGFEVYSLTYARRVF